MSYIKYGVATKIMPIFNNLETDSFVKKYFDLNLFYKNDSSYYLKSEVLSKNLKDFRNELLEITDGKGDSINNCEAYCLNTNADSLLKNKILLIDDNERYCFSNNKRFKFETDQVIMMDDSIGIKLYLIPVFWDVNIVQFESFISVSTFISKLVRTSINNVLKDASFFVVV